MRPQRPDDAPMATADLIRADASERPKWPVPLGRGRAPRVALLTRGLQGGGVQAMMRTMARDLAAGDFDVDLLYRGRRQAMAAAEGIRAVRLGGYPPFIGRIMAWRADPASLPVLARPVLLSLFPPDPLRLLPA